MTSIKILSFISHRVSAEIPPKIHWDITSDFFLNISKNYTHDTFENFLKSAKKILLRFNLEFFHGP